MHPISSFGAYTYITPLEQPSMRPLRAGFFFVLLALNDIDSVTRSCYVSTQSQKRPLPLTQPSILKLMTGSLFSRPFLGVRRA